MGRLRSWMSLSAVMWSTSASERPLVPTNGHFLRVIFSLDWSLLCRGGVEDASGGFTGQSACIYAGARCLPTALILRVHAC